MMPKKKSELPTRNLKFAARITSPEGESRSILWRCSRYYNALVAIERERQGRFAAIRRVHCPELAALEELWEAADDAVSALYAEAKAARADWWRENGGDRVRLLPPEFEPRKAALVAQQKSINEVATPLRGAYKGLFAPARAEFKRRADERTAGRGPRTREKVNAVVRAEMLAEPEWHPAWKGVARSDDEAHDRVLEARARCGLHAGTYLGVEEALARAKKDSAPRPPRFQRFQHSGLIACSRRRARRGAASSPRAGSRRAGSESSASRRARSPPAATSSRSRSTSRGTTSGSSSPRSRSCTGCRRTTPP